MEPKPADQAVACDCEAELSNKTCTDLILLKYSTLKNNLPCGSVVEMSLFRQLRPFKESSSAQFRIFRSFSLLSNCSHSNNV